MARTDIPVQTTGRVAANANISWVAADGANNHQFTNTNSDVILILKNLHTTTHAVTVSRPATVDGASLADLSVTVPANTGYMVLGPFPKSIYNQTGDVVYVGVPVTPTALSLTVLKLGAATV